MPGARSLVTTVLVTAVLAALVLVAPGPATRTSPYLSALADFAAPAALAATHCADKTCTSVGGTCARNAGTFCAKSGGQCFTRGC